MVAEIFRILRRDQRDDGVSMLIVEQNANLALDLADRAYLIETGSVVIGGPAATIRTDDFGAPRLSRLLRRSGV